MKNFDRVKKSFEVFVNKDKENRFILLDSQDSFITNEVLNFFKNDLNNFKKILKEGDGNSKETETENVNGIETSNVIKGDFIVFEDYDLFHHEGVLDDTTEHEFTESCDDHERVSDTIEHEFTESFELLTLLK
jgi:hypothetical protein